MSNNKALNISILVLLLSFVICPMAKNIYSDPDLSKTSRQFEGFTIDFIGIDTPNSTYWSLCNWGMDLTDFKTTHSDVTGGGAYGGLQTVINGKTAILSFWEVLYKENGETKSHRAHRIYPKGDESSFGGEGEGTNYIHEFNWPTNVWHRFVLHSWVDSETKDTYVGEWIQNLSTKEWTLFSYFNTNLKNSFITGGLSQFQENYYDKYFGYKRSFQIKNMYALDKNKKSWISLDTTTLSYDPPSWGYNTAGTHEMGFTDTYFYGSSGLPVDDQKTYDSNNPKNVKGTIKQPSTPDFTKPSFSYVLALLNSQTMIINWEMDVKATPCYQYQIQIFYYTNGGYKKMHTYILNKPEEKKYIYNNYFNGKYQITVTCNAISNESISKTINKEINK